MANLYQMQNSQYFQQCTVVVHLTVLPESYWRRKKFKLCSNLNCSHDSLKLYVQNLIFQIVVHNGLWERSISYHLIKIQVPLYLRVH